MKMKHILIYAVVMLMVSMTACTTNLSPEPPESGEISGHSGTRAQEEAIEVADRFMSVVFGNTRSGRHSVKSVHFDVTRSTRDALAIPTDTLCSIVNYNDDSGFVMMQKDAAGYRLYAISDNGNLNLSDTVFNSGLAHYMRNLRSKHTVEMDKSMHPMVFLSQLQEPTITKYGPMLAASVRNWSQGSPYNQYCPMVYVSGNSNNMVPAVTGCVPTAVGMMMTYFKWPTTIEGRRIDWNRMLKSSYSSGDYSEVANLVMMLGKPDYLNTAYGPFASSTSQSTIIPTLKKWGFKVGSTKFTSSSPLAYLTSGTNSKPVITCGNNTSEGHCWILDGHLSITQYGDEGGCSTNTYYHCVWGWGGSGNGYYYIGNSTSKTGISDSGATFDTKVSIPYQFIDLQYLWDYKPNK